MGKVESATEYSARRALAWRAYYEKNKASVKKRALEWQRENADRYKEIKAKCYLKNRTKVAEASQRYRLSNTPRHLYILAKGRAKRKGLEFSIQIDDIVVPEFCPHLGVRISNDSENVDHRPSLDRKDSSKGYSKDNIMVISHRANRLKNNASGDELLSLALSILRMNGEI